MHSERVRIFKLISQGIPPGPSGEHWWHATPKAPDQVVDADFVFSVHGKRSPSGQPRRQFRTRTPAKNRKSLDDIVYVSKESPHLPYSPDSPDSPHSWLPRIDPTVTAIQGSGEMETTRHGKALCPRFMSNRGKCCYHMLRVCSSMRTLHMPWLWLGPQN